MAGCSILLYHLIPFTYDIGCIFQLQRCYIPYRSLQIVETIREMLGWLYFPDVEKHLWFMFISFYFVRFSIQIWARILVLNFPQPKLACCYRPHKEKTVCTCKSKQMLWVTLATQEFKVVCPCVVYNVYMQWLMQGFSISWIPFVPCSCQLGWVVVDGLPPAPSMSLCQEESTRRLESKLQSHIGPMELQHWKKQRLFILFMILLVLTSWSRLCSFLRPKDTRMAVVHSRSDLWVQNAFNEYWIRSGLRTWEHHGCSYAWKAVETHCTELSAAWLDFQKMLKYRHPSAGSTTLLFVHPCPSYRGNNCHIAMCWRHFGFVLRKRRSQCNSTMYQ